MQNKTSSAVQLKHLPTGMVVKSQATRSREQNRKIARNILAMKLEDIFKGKDSRTAKLREEATRKKASKTKKSKRKYDPFKENDLIFLEVVLKTSYRYIKLETDKSAAVGEKVGDSHEVDGDEVPSAGAESSVRLPDGTIEAAEEVATDLGEPSHKISRRRQVAVHVGQS